MEKEPLLHPTSSHCPQPPPIILCPLPEEDDISIPAVPLTPSEIKDRLIFGPSPSPREASFLLDSVYSSPRPPPSSSPRSNLFDNIGVDLWTKAKGQLHRAKTAPAMAVISELDRRDPMPSPGPASWPILRQGVVLLIIYLSLGVVIYWWNREKFSAVETHPVVDALYFCIVTMCTIGYGDITPNSTVTKMFSILFVLVGFGFIDILLSGMVGYVLDLQESYLLKAAKDRSRTKDDAGSSYIVDVKKGRMRIRMKVGLALCVVILCIGIGTGVMHFIESLGWLDSFYLSVMSVTTVGYGDRAFETLLGRAFASVWLLVSTLAVARAFLYLAEARVDKRQRRLVKWVLGHDMTVSEFLAADTDYNGFITKSEYVLYKLKEMGKVSEKDMVRVSNKFDRLDAGNCGKISLVDLMSSGHH